MRLLERDDALAGLAAALDEARAGSGAVAQVGGEAGIGRTSLLREFPRASRRTSLSWPGAATT